jgi:hypothetical protein
MIVLTANEEQYKALNNYQNDCYVLEFHKDGSDRWIVSIDVLDCPFYEAIHDQLNELERIEYTPFPETE